MRSFYITCNLFLRKKNKNNNNNNFWKKIVFFLFFYSFFKKEKSRRPQKRKRAGTLNMYFFLLRLIYFNTLYLQSVYKFVTYMYACAFLSGNKWIELNWIELNKLKISKDWSLEGAMYINLWKIFRCIPKFSFFVCANFSMVSDKVILKTIYNSSKSILNKTH